MNIGVIGAGSWGTALANLLAGKGIKTTLWAHEREVCGEIKERGQNPTYLPGIKLSANITPTNSLDDAIKEMDVVLWVTPSHVARNLLSRVSSLIHDVALFVVATKGIEEETLDTMAEVVDDTLGVDFSERAAYLSGPSFAREVAERQPTAVTVASGNSETALKVQEVFSTPYFRVYTSDDITGVVIGGAIKNVIALGAGISDGLGFGYNARAALITRGLSEMARLGVAMGANPLTFSGLSGLGDLVLTCTGDLSRNRAVGIRLGRGEKLSDILKEMKMIAEGIKTARAAYMLSRRIGVDMPITEAIYRVLYEGADPKAAVAGLMTRDLKEEINFG